MKNTKIIFILLLFSFGFVSCTKIGRNITVKGKVLNPLTNEPYKDIEIRLLKSKNSDYYGGYKMIKSTTSDDNGAFELNAGRLGPIWLSTNIEDYKEYYSLGFDYEEKYYSALKVDKGEVMNVDYHMVPYGELRIHVQNQNCQGPTDSLNIFFDGSEIVELTGKQDANNKFGSILSEPITGCWDNIGNGFKIPMGKRYYHWTVTRGGNAQTFYDSVNILPNALNTLNVFY